MENASLPPRSERGTLFRSFLSTANVTRRPVRLELELALLSAAKETKRGRRTFFRTMTGLQIARPTPEREFLRRSIQGRLANALALLKRSFFSLSENPSLSIGQRATRKKKNKDVWKRKEKKKW